MTMIEQPTPLYGLQSRNVPDMVVVEQNISVRSLHLITISFIASELGNFDRRRSATVHCDDLLAITRWTAKSREYRGSGSQSVYRWYASFDHEIDSIVSKLNGLRETPTPKILLRSGL